MEDVRKTSAENRWSVVKKAVRFMGMMKQALLLRRAEKVRCAFSD
jgi:hypothetical protein